MKIAVTYKDGKVFEHFGHAEAFKFYTVEDGTVAETACCTPDCTGHNAMADYMKENSVDVVICGGVGQGAKDALEQRGIEVISGAEGSADEAVQAYLKGNLESAGVNCDHHDHGHDEDEGCGCGCGSDCGSGCGGGCGGCGTPQIVFEGKNAGRPVKVHYKGTFNDGTQFDASYDRGEPMEFVAGIGMMIPGFDAAVVDMEVGEVVDIHLMPEQAYGEHNPEAVFEIEIATLPGSEDLEVGQRVYLTNQMGQPIPVGVTAKNDTMITFDANPEMAGKELNFRIELVEVQ